MSLRFAETKHLLWFFGIVPIAIVVLWALSARTGTRAAANSGAKQSTPAVSALGYLEPLGRTIQLSGPASLQPARIDHLLVKEGDLIRAGQALAVLDEYETKKAAWNEAKAHVAEAEARVAQVRAGAKAGDVQAQEALLAQAASKLANARREYERYLQLHDAGVVASEVLEFRKSEYESSEAEYRRDEAALQSVREVRPVDLRLAEAALSSAQTAVAQARADLDLTVLRSPITGQVLKIHALPGEVIAAKGVMDLGDTRHISAVAEVFETDVARVRVGERARVTVRAINKTLAGTVTQIGYQIGKKNVFGDDPSSAVDARVVEVRISLDGDASAEVAGLTNTRVDVVFLP
jgi:HlyD family secretion protein